MLFGKNYEMMIKSKRILEGVEPGKNDIQDNQVNLTFSNGKNLNFVKSVEGRATSHI